MLSENRCLFDPSAITRARSWVCRGRGIRRSVILVNETKSQHRAIVRRRRLYQSVSGVCQKRSPMLGLRDNPGNKVSLKGKAGEFEWQFQWVSDEVNCLLSLPRRALIKEPLGRFLEQRDYQLPGGDYAYDSLNFKRRVVPGSVQSGGWRQYHPLVAVAVADRVAVGEITLWGTSANSDRAPLNCCSVHPP